MFHHPFTDALLAQFWHLVPETVLVLFASVLYVGGAFTPAGRGRNKWGAFALLGLAAALVAIFALPAAPSPGASVFGIPFVFDGLAQLTRVVAIVTGLVLVTLSWNEVPDRQVTDHHACLLIIIAGTCLVGSANDLAAMFLALEMVSIPTYVLLYLPRHDDAAQEAAMKYFLLSILSSALLLFGFSYLYGLGGTTNLAGILDALQTAQRDDWQAGAERFSAVRGTTGVALVALVMIVAGLGFRITAVPFHFYAPDVYQGTSVSGAAMLAVIPKVAGFAALLRVLGFVMPPGVPGEGLLGLALSRPITPILFWFLAAITMTLGNLLALLQDNLRRLIAYSGVANSGYMLVALASAPYLTGDVVGGTSALLYYLVAYAAMTVGLFAIILMFDSTERPVETVEDLAGFARSHPGLALMVAVLLFSLIGIPLTAGFTGKFLIFFGALSVPGEAAWLYRVLALVGVLNAALSGWYYLRIIAVMYLRTSVRPIERPTTTTGMAVLTTSVVLTVALSVGPGADVLLRAARRSTPAMPAAAPAVARAEAK